MRKLRENDTGSLHPDIPVRQDYFHSILAIGDNQRDDHVIEKRLRKAASGPENHENEKGRSVKRVHYSDDFSAKVMSRRMLREA